MVNQRAQDQESVYKVYILWLQYVNATEPVGAYITKCKHEACDYFHCCRATPSLISTELHCYMTEPRVCVNDLPRMINTTLLLLQCQICAVLCTEVVQS